MASRLEQDLSCPICCELFRDPVVLTCSHSFCKVCLENWWEDKPLKTCPVCKRRSSKNHPPMNLALKNLVETFTEEKGQTAPAAEQTSPSPQQPECSLHSEKLRLFCLDHQELICLVCRDSRTHKDHRFSPIEEAASDLREQLRRNIKPLQDKLKVLDESRAQFDEAAAHISLQTKQTQTQIRAEFEKLHQFLRDEEESRMKALREEEEQKIQNMKDKMAALSKDMEALSKTISETEEQLRAADASFLLQYKTAEERLQRCPLVEEPKIKRLDLIDQAKHLGNLGFNIWMNMKKLVQFFPVVLDPNTAAPDLILSEDLTSVRKGEKQKVPENSERLSDGFVDGSESFVSGTHSWEVEVGASKAWSVGVIGHVQRGADTEYGSWFIRFTEGKYSAFSLPDTDKRLSVKNLQRVRVKLDFDTKTLTFTDLDTNTVLHTVTDSFSWIVPCLRTSDAPLKISPKSITVTV
uniref:Zinc-binding protein A33-like n=1 Tax=Neogobius melanostomus TaxID=47308 RepID=A0A8C6SMB1_9GOBI